MRSPLASGTQATAVAAAHPRRGARDAPAPRPGCELRGTGPSLRVRRVHRRPDLQAVELPRGSVTRSATTAATTTRCRPTPVRTATTSARGSVNNAQAQRKGTLNEERAQRLSKLKDGNGPLRAAALPAGSDAWSENGPYARLQWRRRSADVRLERFVDHHARVDAIRNLNQFR